MDPPSIWKELAGAITAQFGAVAEVGPWLRFTVANGGAERVAMRHADFLGLDVAVLLAYIGPLHEMSVFIAMEANNQLEGASLVLSNEHYAIRLIVPLALGWPTLRAGCERLAATARAIRQLARADRGRHGVFGHYAE